MWDQCSTCLRYYTVINGKLRRHKGDNGRLCDGGLSGEPIEGSAQDEARGYLFRHHAEIQEVARSTEGIHGHGGPQGGTNE